MVFINLTYIWLFVGTWTDWKHDEGLGLLIKLNKLLRDVTIVNGGELIWMKNVVNEETLLYIKTFIVALDFFSLDKCTFWYIIVFMICYSTCVWLAKRENNDIANVIS